MGSSQRLKGCSAVRPSHGTAESPNEPAWAGAVSASDATSASTTCRNRLPMTAIPPWPLESQCLRDGTPSASLRRGNPLATIPRSSETPSACQAPNIRCGDDRGAVHCGRPRPASRRADRGRPRPGDGTARRRGTRAQRLSAHSRSSRSPSRSRSCRPPTGRRLAGRLRPPRPRLRVAARVEFEVGPGFAVPTADRLRPDALPAADRPGARCASRSASSSAPRSTSCAGSVHGERALLEVFSAWHALGPAAVLALAGEPDADLVVLPAARPRARSPSSGSTSPARPSRARSRSASPPARSSARTAPCLPRRCGAGARRLPLRGRRLRPALRHPARPPARRALRLLRAGAAQPHRPRARARASLPRHCLPPRRRDRGRRRLHRQPQPDVVELVVAVVGRARPRRALAADAELTALLHDVGKIRIPAEIINKPGKLTDEEWAVIEDPHGRGRAHARPDRRPARPRRPPRPLLPRALGRKRLSRRVRRPRTSPSSRGSCAPATPTTR